LVLGNINIDTYSGGVFVDFKHFIDLINLMNPILQMLVSLLTLWLRIKKEKTFNPIDIKFI
jgi:hypothetical protein